MTHSNVSSLIGDLYDAALDPPSWKGIGAKIATAFSSSSCALQVRTASNEMEIVSRTGDLEDRLWQMYKDHYYTQDLWVNEAVKLPPGTVFVDTELVSEAQARRSEIFEWLERMNWLEKMNSLKYCGAVISLGGSDLGLVGIHRGSGQREFSVADKQHLGILLPHIQRALQLRRKMVALESQRDAAASGFDRLKVAALICDNVGRIVLANAKADDLLREADGISGVNGRIMSKSPLVSEKLRFLIAHASLTASGRSFHSGGYVSVPRRKGRPLVVLVCPLRPGSSTWPTQIPSSLILIRDPDANRPVASAPLRALFGLTAAEAKIAAALVDGKSIEEIAALYGRSLFTIRAHLKKIFAKTDTTRQSALVALILRNLVDQ